jgi:hypothetical protein
MLQKNSIPSDAAGGSSKFNRILGMLIISLALSGSIASPVMALDLIEALFGSSAPAKPVAETKTKSASGEGHHLRAPAHTSHQDVAHKSDLRVMAAVEKPIPFQRPVCCSTSSDSVNAAINDPTLRPGDAYAAEDGIKVYVGSKTEHQSARFVAAGDTGKIDASLRAKLVAYVPLSSKIAASKNAPAPVDRSAVKTAEEKMITDGHGKMIRFVGGYFPSL